MTQQNPLSIARDRAERCLPATLAFLLVTAAAFATQPMAPADPPRSAEQLDTLLADSPDDVDLLLERTQAAMSDRDGEAALRFVARAETLDAEKARLTAIQVLLAAGALEPALARIQVATAAAPDDLDLALLHAFVLRDLQRDDDARSVLTDAVTRHPESAPLAEQLALLSLGARDVIRAAETATAALERGLTTPLLHFAAGVGLGADPARRTDAIGHLRKALELGVPQPERTLFELGTLLADEGDHAGAVEALQQAKAKLPNNSDVSFRLAQSLRSLGRIEEAAAELTRFQQLSEAREQSENRARSAGIALNRAQELASSGQLQQALDETGTILEQYPGHPQTLLLRSKVQLSLGQTEPALGGLAQVIEAQPSNPEPHFLQGITLRQLDRPAEARAALERALALRSDIGEAHAVLGGILLDTEEWQAATDSFARALELGVEGVELRAGLALALRSLGREEEAQQQLELARQIREKMEP